MGLYCRRRKNRRELLLPTSRQKLPVESFTYAVKTKNNIFLSKPCCPSGWQGFFLFFEKKLKILHRKDSLLFYLPIFAQN
jgi:hypothetical protein